MIILTNLLSTAATAAREERTHIYTSGCWSSSPFPPFPSSAIDERRVIIATAYMFLTWYCCLPIHFSILLYWTELNWIGLDWIEGDHSYVKAH